MNIIEFFNYYWLEMLFVITFMSIFGIASIVEDIKNYKKSREELLKKLEYERKQNELFNKMK